MPSVADIISAIDHMNYAPFTVKMLNVHMGLNGNGEGKNTSTLLNELCKRGHVRKLSIEGHKVTYQAGKTQTVADAHQSWITASKQDVARKRELREQIKRPVRVHPTQSFPLGLWRPKHVGSNEPRFVVGGM